MSEEKSINFPEAQTVGMTGKVESFTSDSPVDYLWKRLRFFQDVEFVSELIGKLHSSASQANRKKQATQLGYCIRQGEEYFRASQDVGLPTRPTLMYYGIVSLTKALTLLRLTGDYSFDRLRRYHHHQSHGLDMCGSVKDIKAGDSAEKFFQLVRCTIHTHSQQSTTPWGHFPLFYQSLINCSHKVYVNTRIRRDNKWTAFVGYQAEAGPDRVPISQLIGRTITALELMKTLPDLADTMSYLGLNPDLATGSVTVQHTFVTVQSGDKPSAKATFEYTYAIDQITPELGEKYAALYKKHNPAIQLANNVGSNIVFKWIRKEEIGGPTASDQTTNANDTRWSPDIVDAIGGKKYYVASPETYLVEPAAIHILLFCFSNLARYYPDLWMGTIDHNVRIAELMDLLMNICYRKFPNLILDQLTGVHHYVSMVQSLRSCPGLNYVSWPADRYSCFNRLKPRQRDTTSGSGPSSLLAR